MGLNYHMIERMCRSFDSGVYEQALRDVLGGPIEFNGRTILPPKPGMTEDSFEDMMEKLEQADLIEYGNGAPVFGNGDPFQSAMLKSKVFGEEAELISSGPGRYLILYPGLGYAQSSDDGVYELDLRAFVDR